MEFMEAALGRLTNPMLLGSLALLAAVFLPLEFFFPLVRKRPLMRLSNAVDVGFLCVLIIMGPLTSAVRGFVVLTVLSGVLHGWEPSQMQAGHGLIASLPVWLRFLLLPLVHDFLAYWVHRFQHTRYFWPFHAVHHSSEHVNWASLFRFHPVDTIFMHACRGGGLLLLGFPLRDIILYEITFFFVIGAFAHANINVPLLTRAPFKYLLISPLLHHWHHTAEEAAVGKNMALVFPFWDRLFGTFMLPERPPSVLGLSEPMGSSLPRLLFQPFVLFFKSLGQPFRQRTSSSRSAPL
jgi:sterol desaturase/sphingolipid hydroxylase (fatty acid hydroxylase superfamily)